VGGYRIDAAPLRSRCDVCGGTRQGKLGTLLGLPRTNPVASALQHKSWKQHNRYSIARGRIEVMAV
jgi:hypothetical protein